LDDNRTQLYMKQGLLSISSNEINYLTAISDKNFWIVLLNESDKTQNVAVKINTPYVKTNSEAIEYSNFQSSSLSGSSINITNSNIETKISAKGISIISIPINGQKKEIEERPVKMDLKLSSWIKIRNFTCLEYALLSAGIPCMDMLTRYCLKIIPLCLPLILKIVWF